MLQLLIKDNAAYLLQAAKPRQDLQTSDQERKKPNSLSGLGQDKANAPDA